MDKGPLDCPKCLKDIIDYQQKKIDELKQAIGGQAEIINSQDQKIDELEKKLAEAMELVDELYEISLHIPSNTYYKYKDLKKSLKEKEG
jgi:uncharacterized protein (DUF3084 family)